MADAINGLLADPDRAAAFGQAGRDLVTNHYRWDARLAPLAALLFPDRERAAA